MTDLGRGRFGTLLSSPKELHGQAASEEEETKGAGCGDTSEPAVPALLSTCRVLHAGVLSSLNLIFVQLFDGDE